MKINKCDTPQNKLKNKNLTIISIEVEKSLEKIQYRFLIRTLSKISIEGTFYNTIKAIYETPHDQHHKGEKLEASLIISEIRQGCPLSLLLFNMALEVLSRALG